MSNAEASRLYEAIISEVINDSRQDFENIGVHEDTLQELKRIWRSRLTQSQVSKFSWDDEHQVNVYQNLNVGLKHELQDDLLINNGYDQLSYPNDAGVSANDIGIQLPNIGSQQDYDDNGLILPSVGQTDGAPQQIEFTVETSQPGKLLKKLQQTDGELGGDLDDNLFNDSDDINSELDDDLDSDRSDDEDKDGDGDIMLCLYDKVQRIKNKWKCSLKEGVTHIHGKDYVFQKATGESEW